MKTQYIGHLVAFSGTVTRASEVRPELLYGVFKCELCGMLSGKIEQQFKYTEPSFCSQRACANRTKWSVSFGSMLRAARNRCGATLCVCVCVCVPALRCLRCSWTCLRRTSWIGSACVCKRTLTRSPPVSAAAPCLHSASLCRAKRCVRPAGSMPRSVDVVLRHAAVEKAKAGDKCTFTGTLIVVPDVSQLYKAGQVPRSYQSGAGEKESEGFTGLKALGVRDLTYRTAFLASSVSTEASRAGGGASGASQIDLFTQSERDNILAMSRDPEIYKKMVRSIAPTVYGHDEVKRGILLMLLGGVPKQTGDGSKCVTGCAGVL